MGFRESSPSTNGVAVAGIDPTDLVFATMAGGIGSRIGGSGFAIENRMLFLG